MSSMDSLLVPIKLVCLFVAPASYYVAHTPPNPPSPPKDRVATGQFFDKFVRHIAWSSKIIVSLVFASEFLVTFKTAYPQLLSTSPVAPYISFCPHTSNAPETISFNPSFCIAALITFASALVRVWCFKTLKRFFLYEVAVLGSHSLVTSGPYSIVRHPAYTSAIASILGIMVMLMQLSYGGWDRECGIVSNAVRVGVWWQYIVGTLAIIPLFRRCRFEDEMLRGRFTEEWDQWSKNVPYRLWPGLY